MAKKCKTNKCSTKSCDGCSSSTTAETPPVNVIVTPMAAFQQPDYEVIANPAEAVGAHAHRFTELYAQYGSLRDLAKLINGLPTTATFPDGVTVDKVQIDYTANHRGQSVVIRDVQTVGELSLLLASALSHTVEQIYRELSLLDQVAGAMRSAVNAARTPPPPQPPISLQSTAT